MPVHIVLYVEMKFSIRLWLIDSAYSIPLLGIFLSFANCLVLKLYLYTERRLCRPAVGSYRLIRSINHHSYDKGYGSTCSLLLCMSSLFQGNKGAVSVRFNIYGCSVCLVNSHLAAHEHLLEERISDYNTIIKEHSYHLAETSNILYHE